ncbi:cytochrome b561 [Jannaschia seosinensis]|uniref:Cytochrome b561 n=1 Tax=Jannaschia seosinensis TaxID=313367 RepID=A0A0M7BAY7_9RHOB|nr:cytochrome b/b6 domain-containing protein [Jannaschia seosinensis]CUH39349.1 cytochrome b561 [Jannaschia seosinensis]
MTATANIPPPERRRAATNSDATYGWVARSFHWTIAVLILTALVLGKLAHDAPYATDAELARKAFLFSFHKTTGVTIFFVALARILWAMTQPHPRPLHGGAEAFLASIVHWLLYGSLVLVPALGWAEHAATSGFAPIWWPFGQSLPFVPQDADLAARLAVLHTTFVKVLVGALVLHVAGTVKHVVIDRDDTFGRMWRGTRPARLAAAKGHGVPAIAAVAVWGATLIVGLNLAPEGSAVIASTAAVEAEGTSNWTVTEGTLSITVTQMGSAVTGSFADWDAAIDFDETPREDGTLGAVEVSIATGSLALGSVSQQATGEEFLASGAFPTARFTGVIREAEVGYVADGAVTIRGAEVPVVLPFDLDIDGDRAVMAGQIALDRRDYAMGESYPDESNVGFGVTVNVALEADRGADG